MAKHGVCVCVYNLISNRFSFSSSVWLYSLLYYLLFFFSLRRISLNRIDWIGITKISYRSLSTFSFPTQIRWTAEQSHNNNENDKNDNDWFIHGVCVRVKAEKEYYCCAFRKIEINRINDEKCVRRSNQRRHTTFRLRISWEFPHLKQLVTLFRWRGVCDNVWLLYW